MTREEFQWAWDQSPSTEVIRTLESYQRVVNCWDKAWYCAGPLTVASDPTTVCRNNHYLILVVPLEVKAQVEGPDAIFRIAVGYCRSCGRIYWQADNMAAAVGHE